MTDTTGDMPWMQPQPPAPEAAPARQPRQKRKPKEAAAPKIRKPRAVKPTVEAAPAPTPKLRKEKAERMAPETVKVSIKDYAEMRVTAYQREFVKLHKILAPIAQKARAQIIAELTKVLG